MDKNSIYYWRPWQHSTGPKTPEGKSKVSKNARKHGLYVQNDETLELQELKKLFMEVKL